MPKLVVLTSLAILAFAGNSILCRLALADPAIDAASFTLIRIVSGAVFLVMLLALKQGGLNKPGQGNWLGALYLSAYALAFSFAYISLDTGVGALILFGTVQLTMITLSLFSGGSLSRVEYLGVITAFSGLVYLLLPGATSPSPVGFALMCIAGIAWGFYTLHGRRSVRPLADTGNNFVCSIPMVLVPFLLSLQSMEISQEGVILAVLSGTMASGLGYAIWYTVLPLLNVTLAAVLQLLVPIVAAIGGVLFADEALGLQLVVSSTLVLGGILMVILAKRFA